MCRQKNFQTQRSRYKQGGVPKESWKTQKSVAPKKSYIFVLLTILRREFIYKRKLSILRRKFIYKRKLTILRREFIYKRKLSIRSGHPDRLPRNIGAGLVQPGQPDLALRVRFRENPRCWKNIVFLYVQGEIFEKYCVFSAKCSGGPPKVQIQWKILAFAWEWLHVREFV